MKAEERNALRSAVVLFREIGAALTEAITHRVDPSMAQNSAVAILATLGRSGPLRPQQLLEPSGLSSAGLSGAMARLEGLGFVARDPHGVEDDQRGVLVSLTRAGKRALADMLDVLDDGIRPVIERVKDLDSLVQALPASEVPSITTRDADWRLEVMGVAARFGTALGQALRFTAANEHEIDGIAVGAMCVVDEAGVCRPGYLVERLGLTSGGVTRVIDRLEAAGLCAREYGVSAEDRRGVFVSLTGDGVRALDAAMERLAEHVELLADAAHLLGMLADAAR